MLYLYELGLNSFPLLLLVLLFILVLLVIEFILLYI